MDRLITPPFGGAASSIAQLSIDHLIVAHHEMLTPFLRWDRDSARIALSILDDEVDRHIEQSTTPEPARAGHEIARLLLRAVLAMRASQGSAGSPVIRRGRRPGSPQPLVPSPASDISAG